MLLAMGAGVLMANLLPAIVFGGGGMPLSEVAAAVTGEGNGWVMTLVWLAGLIALLSVFVFPPEERFIQAVAISLGSVVVLVLPVYVSRNVTAIEPQATGLGPGMLGMTVAYLAAAVLPWFNLLWWNRTKPVLGLAWQKWLFIGPAAFWILGLTVFPLAYAITTSRYAFRTGKIVKDIGWGNYRKLFNDVLLIRPRVAKRSCTRYWSGSVRLSPFSPSAAFLVSCLTSTRLFSRPDGRRLGFRWRLFQRCCCQFRATRMFCRPSSDSICHWRRFSRRTSPSPSRSPMCSLLARSPSR
jgi:hypothetical protein